jgi:hypothetical protein
MDYQIFKKTANRRKVMNTKNLLLRDYLTRKALAIKVMIRKATNCEVLIKEVKTRRKHENVK